MSNADRLRDRDGSDCPERDAMVATLLGITPERLRTIRRVHAKRVGSSKPAGRVGAEARWQVVDQLDDDALHATFRRREARTVSRAGIASPMDRFSRRPLGLR